MQNGKKCLKCGKPKADSAFFKSSSAYHKDGLVPICRKCIIEATYDPEINDINIDSFSEILRQVDKPYIDSVLNAAEKQFAKGVQNGKIADKEGIERVKAIVGLYFKNLNSLNQYKQMTWDDRISQDDTEHSKREVVILDTPQKIFGGIYNKTQLRLMQALYDFWAEGCGIKNDKERDALINYVKERLYQENALMFNDYGLCIDCNNDTIAAVTKLKTLRGGEDAKFINWYKANYIAE